MSKIDHIHQAHERVHDGPSILLNGADGNLVLRRQQKVLPAVAKAAADADGAD